VTISSTLLASCATKVTAAQRTELPRVAIARTELKSAAYLEPYGADVKLRQAFNQSGNSGQAGAGGADRCLDRRRAGRNSERNVQE